jgi:hypothetical protein
MVLLAKGIIPLLHSMKKKGLKVTRNGSKVNTSYTLSIYILSIFVARFPSLIKMLFYF